METTEEKTRTEPKDAGQNPNPKKEKKVLPDDFKGLKRDDTVKEFDDHYDGKWYRVTFKPRLNVDAPTAMVKDTIALSYVNKLKRFNNRESNSCDVVSVEEVK